MLTTESHYIGNFACDMRRRIHACDMRGRIHESHYIGNFAEYEATT
jgi:hypothetical protein